MRVRPEQLSAHLQRTLEPLYTVFGDEPLLCDEAASAIRNAARLWGCVERQVLNADTSFDWAVLATRTINLSLFGSRQIVELHIVSGKPGTAGGAALEAYCASLPGDTLTLVVLPKLDQKNQASSWFRALDGAGVTIAVYAVERAGLPGWIKARLAAQNQRVDREGMDFLVDRLEGNLLAAHQEI
ncbi:MAG: DNA polymerase III subunit delta, partial [Burkholderiales bacterium]